MINIAIHAARQFCCGFACSKLTVMHIKRSHFAKWTGKLSSGCLTGKLLVPVRFCAQLSSKISLPVSLCTLIVRPDLTCTELGTSSLAGNKQEKSNISARSLMSFLNRVILSLISSISLAWHIVRTGLVFLPCILCSPLLLLPYSLFPTNTLLDMLVWSMESAGPVYIKLSQWASTRRDIFPSSVCSRLTKLQRYTKPHPWNNTREVLEKELGENWEEMINLDREVVGSGCCAQVYRGWLLQEDKEVAVKVVHPGLAKQLEMDLLVMSTAASWLTWFVPSLEWLSLERAVREFRELMVGQVDMRKEASNLVRFRENFSGSTQVSFPEPVHKYCTAGVLVEDWVKGVGIEMYMDQTGKEGELVRSRLAEVGVEMLLKMIFTDNYWHGDLHPGNILVTSENQLCVLDTGIASSLSMADRDNLVLTFKAVVLGDSCKVGELFLERSYHECMDKEAFKKDMQAIVEEARSNQLSLDRVDVSSLLQSVFTTLMNHKVRLDANFSSVVIAIAIVEGLGRVLDPKLDLVTRAIPYLVRQSI